MRIVSLLPSATEILFAIGAGPEVVGVTFECDYPAEARTRKIVSTSALPEGLSPREIDEFVSKAVANGDDLYRLHADDLADLDADLVITQDLCAVCAIDVTAVDDALSYLGCRAEVVTIDPGTLGEVLDSIETLGQITAHTWTAKSLLTTLEQRLAEVRRVARSSKRVLVLEWTDPPFAPGHWLPEMIAAAGGIPVLGEPGARSHRITWDEAVTTDPDVVIVAPCGYGLEAATELAEPVRARFPGVPVHAVDADGCFTRPGPRLVDGIETLARLFGSIGEDGDSPVGGGADLQVDGGYTAI